MSSLHVSSPLLSSGRRSTEASNLATNSNPDRTTNSLPHNRATPTTRDRLVLPPEFLAAALSSSRVSASPHNLYKYPARFAPEFAREAIRAFSQPGDVVLDVFQGGGTAVIEAMALGRHAVGYDISELACFLARTKTTPLSVHDERALIRWSNELTTTTNGAGESAWAAADTEDGYYRRNLPKEAHAFFAAVIAQLPSLSNSRQRNFARLNLLSVGQWALDCKKVVPTSAMMQTEFQSQLIGNVRAFRSYTWNLAKQLGIRHGTLSSRRKIVRASSEICGENGRAPRRKVALIVTSPPYPGVHMLYHRWQILGRRETPAPFIIADCRDGAGISFYNLGHRGEVGLKTYYDRLTTIFKAARTRLRRDALVVQMVAFNQPSWQLPAFLHAMDAAGYDQVMPELPTATHLDGNLWRAVPGRKWYAATRKHANGAAKEVVLFHRPHWRDEQIASAATGSG